MSYEKAESVTGKVVVVDKVKPTLSINPQEVSVAKGQTVTFSGTLLNPLKGGATGGIEGKTINLIINDEKAGHTKTDDGGNWEISYTFPESGTYKVKATFEEKEGAG